MSSRETPPLMMCGHTANATSGGKPCCAICIGIDAGATEVNESPPDLTGRKSTCTTCGRQVDSSLRLAFFAYQPNSETDSHYDGCRGWD